MSDGGASPLPEFGSQRLGTYYVVLVGTRPSPDRVRQTVSALHLQHHVPVILYFGRLSLTQRDEWARYCRQHKFAALLIDELMLFYVSSERRLRLPRIVQLSMAWGYANPYTPFAAGAVPPEMFKGRDDIVRKLIEPSGSSIIYGGRQLGKSAILRRVERELSQRPGSASTLVCYLDIKQLGARESSTSKRPSAVWGMIREWLISNNLMRSSTLADPGTVQSHLKELLRKDEARRIYLLLDEADRFLEADAAKDFDTIHQLKAIGDESGRRFKIILSGLHSVQRYGLLPNQPLAHMGQPLVVGPLSPNAALQLIREPMETLGLRFDSDEALYRILCYTNYHPALIQHFCHELIDSRNQRRMGRPPHSISLSDVERVYRRREVRDVIRDRFEWTIAPDDRYQALVYAIASDQLSHRDGYRQEYDANQVMELARGVWPAAFAGTGMDDIRALLDELIGLGVLVKSPSGRYRLRNGNIVRALGSAEEIEHRVEQFAKREAPALQYDPKAVRELLGDSPIEFSPLTLEQESIVTERSGLCLLVASEALGLGRVWSALRRFARAGRDESSEALFERVERLPPNLVSRESIERYLSGLRRDTRRGRVLVHADASTLHGEATLSSLFTGLADWLERYSGRDRVIRVVVAMAPETLYQWYLEPPEVRKAAEDAANGWVVPARFSDQSLERYFSMLGLLNTAETRAEVYRRTGGWPWLIDRLVRTLQARAGSSLEGLDPRVALDEAMGAEDQGGEPWIEEFRRATGIEAIPFARELLGLIHELQPVDVGDLTLDLMEPTPAQLGPREFEAALRSLETLRLLVPGAQGAELCPVVRGILGLRSTQRDA